MSQLLVTFLLLLIWTDTYTCATASDYDSLYNDIFTGYNPNLLPVINQADTTSVGLNISIVSINDFNQLSGELILTTLFVMNWHEKRISWNQSEFSNISNLLLNKDDIWIPRLLIKESSDKVQEIGKQSTQARIFNNGEVIWNCGYISKTTCSLDVKYFPFDTQTCSITAIGSYLPNEVLIYTQTNTADTSFLSDNSQWELSSTEIRNETIQVTTVLRLKRRTVFYIVYIIIPILLLGLINNLVFVMPASSGERTSVAVTTFLSFVVYMDIVNNNVPESSAPVANLYYYLLFLMIYSSTIMLLCVVSLRIYDKDTPIPNSVQKLMVYLRFCCLKRKRSFLVYPAEEAKQDVPLEKEKEHISKEAKPTDEEHVTENQNQITWKIVSETFDIYCSVALMLTFSIITLITFTKLKSGNDF